jgi:hypothetical protein
LPAGAFCDLSSARRWFSVVCCTRAIAETGNVDTHDQRLVAYPGDVAVGASRGFDQPSGALERADFGRVASASSFSLGSERRGDCSQGRPSAAAVVEAAGAVNRLRKAIARQRVPMNQVAG